MAWFYINLEWVFPPNLATLHKHAQWFISWMTLDPVHSTVLPIVASKDEVMK